MNPVIKPIFLIVAIICAAVFTVVGFGWVTVDNPFGWLGLALTFGLASRLP